LKRENIEAELNSSREDRLISNFFTWFSRPFLLFGLVLTIPAFYLMLWHGDDKAQLLGQFIYVVSALMLAIDSIWNWYRSRLRVRKSGKLILDGVIILGCVMCALPSDLHWSVFEWLLRLGLCALILLRIATLVLQHIQPSQLVQMIGLALVMLSTAGAGFYWLEPSVVSYADGVWLAFTTIATVGYGDIVPSTPASKIFAVFIVLLGYAVFSIVTANIAALFVGEEEEIIERELHEDIRALHQEVVALREQLRSHEEKIDSMERASHQSD
jgi:voltage-gated potassium channel